jgi:glycosyltransferase involved in cell wall biosynthesis
MRSVLDQGYPRLEYILIDGGSTDGSVKIVKQHAAELHYWTIGPDKGQSDAINKGFGRCSGAVVTWLNADDFYLPGALFAVAEAFHSNPQAAFYFGNGWRVDVNGDRKSEFFPEGRVCFDRRCFLYGLNTLLQPATFINRHYLERAGMLNPALRYAMDTDLWIRLSALAAPAAIDACLAASREYPETKTRRGAFERTEEIRRLYEGYTGVPMTPGALCYFLDTLRNAVRQRPDVFPREFDRQIVAFWGHAAAAMTRFGCRGDGFPDADAAGERGR